MTFEEFFKKKKISLALLQSSEPALFAEFKNHFEQMGEKSFDHTKKYWFNQLRRRFPTPIEPKVEKVRIENPIAEQTITESLEESSVSVPATGFKPRFKAAVAIKPDAEQTPESKPADTNDNPAEEAAKPAVGFKPRFNAARMVKPEEAGEKAELPAEPGTEKPVDDAPKPAVGFKPRFNAAKMAKPAEANAEPEVKAGATAENLTAEEAPKPAVGFKPRFNAAKMAKPAEPAAESEAISEEPPITDKPVNEEVPKPAVGFKPRFNAAKMKPKEE